MLTVEETRAIANTRIEGDSSVCLNPAGPAAEAGDFVVWVYNKIAYWEDRSFVNMIFGNGPIVVDRRDGTVHVIPSSMTTEEGLDNIRRTGSVDG